MKRIFAALILCFSVTPVIAVQSNIFATSCGQSAPDYDTNFCPSFKSAVECYCEQEDKMPSSFCSNMNAVYSAMISTYGSLETACKNQSHASYQTCVDDWNCYRKGGKDSNGNLCSSTGNACQ